MVDDQGTGRGVTGEAPLLYVDQKTPIRCLSLDRDELRKLLEWLQERSLAAAELEVARFQPRPDHTSENIEIAKRNLREAFKLWLTVGGTGGSELTGGIGTVFGSANFPEEVKSVFCDVSIPLQSRFSYGVANKFDLYLDFTRPDVLNFAVMPSQPTPNQSNFHVHGNDASWVNGLFFEFTEYVRAHRSTASWLHRHSVYDVLLWLVGFPLALWGDARASSTIQKLSTSAFVQAGFYVYLYLAALVGIRFLFHYARWIWPLIEYRQPKSRALVHKAAWTVIVLGALSTAIMDFIKKLF